MTTLDFRNVTKIYNVRGSGQLKALDDVSFTLSSRQTLGLVGQSGSGKSTIAKILTQLETPTSGQVLLDGEPIPRSGKQLRKYRQQLRMVFQDPFASLNPYHSIRHHIERPLRLDGREADARKLASDFLAQHPQDGEAAEFLGKLAAHAGDWKRARALFDYARTLRDGGGRDPLLYATLAEAQLRLGDGAAALNDAQGAFEMQRANPAINLVLARVLQQAGREREARALVAKADRLQEA